MGSNIKKRLLSLNMSINALEIGGKIRNTIVFNNSNSNKLTRFFKILSSINYILIIKYQIPYLFNYKAVCFI